MRRTGVLMIIAASAVFGCATAPWDGDVEAGGPPREQPEKKDYLGMVESVREVEVDSERSGAAPMVGAVIGGTAGSSVGRGRGAAAAGAVGAVVGAVVGEAAAQTGVQQGYEITVKLDSGGVIAVTQPAGKETFKPGDRVRVVSDGRTARVMR